MPNFNEISSRITELHETEHGHSPLTLAYNTTLHSDNGTLSGCSRTS